MKATPDSRRDRLRAQLFFVVTLPACAARACHPLPARLQENALPSYLPSGAGPAGSGQTAGSRGSATTGPRGLPTFTSAFTTSSSVLSDSWTLTSVARCAEQWCQ